MSSASAVTYSGSTSLSKTETWSLLALSGASIAVVFQTFQGDGAPLIASMAFAGLSFAMCYAMVRWLGATFVKAGLKGRDMSKRGQPVIPETMGAVAAVVYLFVIICFIPFPFYKDIVAATSGGGNRDTMLEVKNVDTGRFLHRFPHSKLASYLSAIISLQSVVLLGIGDDLFDIRWRHKVLIPAFASIPILIVYFVDFGVTKVVIPTRLQPFLGELLDLGWLYYAYMSSISIFCPNSINILAGINGIEVAQSIVVALLILLNDLFYIYPTVLTSPLQSSTLSTPTPHPATDSHLFSMYLLLPFLGVSLALLAHNWFPARVFVGDTYCYFAGMVFAVVAILAHFSKTLLLLLVPQVFNFAYSAPQLFAIIPCPRHRLPHFNARTGLLEPSWADWSAPLVANEDFATATLTADKSSAKANGANGHSSTPRSPSPAVPPPSTSGGGLSMHRPVVLKRPLHPLVQTLLKTLHALRLLKVETDPVTGDVVRTTNFTLINLWLVWFGPMREDQLALSLVGAQAVLGLLGLLTRHKLALLVFPRDNK